MSAPRPVIFQRIITDLPIEDHRRLKAFCESHGVAIHKMTQDVLSTYTRYLENGQWAVTVPAELIQPVIDAARAGQVSVPGWIEASLRQSLQIPPAPVYKRGRPAKEHPENVTIFCRCGCGTALTKYDRAWRARKYVAGHQMKAGRWLVGNRPTRNRVD